MTGKIRRALRVFASSFLWLAVLVPILGVSGYSLYVIGRHLGAPWFVAAAISTCFDGVALLAAGYSVRYAQATLSGGLPRTVVRAYAILAAFLQTFHARIGHEPPGSWILWASLPIGAVTVYEVHIRWERRKALARAGSVYPAPLPSFGLATWVLFPLTTLDALRKIVEARRDALVAAANVVIADFASKSRSQFRPQREEAAAGPVAEVVPETRMAERRRKHQARPAGSTSHAPVRHIRRWAIENGYQVSTHARLPRYVIADYNAAMAESGTGAGGG